MALGNNWTNLWRMISGSGYEPISNTGNEYLGASTQGFSTSSKLAMVLCYLIVLAELNSWVNLCLVQLSYSITQPGGKNNFPFACSAALLRMVCFHTVKWSCEVISWTFPFYQSQSLHLPWNPHTAAIFAILWIAQVPASIPSNVLFPTKLIHFFPTTKTNDQPLWKWKDGALLPSKESGERLVLPQDPTHRQMKKEPKNHPPVLPEPSTWSTSQELSSSNTSAIEIHLYQWYFKPEIYKL